MLSGDTAAYDLAAALLEAARVRLAASAAGEPDRVCVVPGAIAWDDCECGQLAVAVDQIYLSDQIVGEQASLATSTCAAAYMVVDVVVQVVRCAPQPVGMDTAVSCVALDAAARTVATDASAVLLAVACKLAEMEDTDEIAGHLVRAQRGVGPAGACVGSEVRASAALRR